MIEVIGTDVFEEWFLGLNREHRHAVMRIVDLLENEGVALGYPYSSAVRGSKYALRELRAAASGHALRVFYIFDPERNAVLLCGGDKTGVKRFYEKAITTAEKQWDEYLVAMRRK
jgi:hypothetical protein